MTRKLIQIVLTIAVAAGIAFATNGPQPLVGLIWYDNADPTLGGGMAAPLNQLLIRTDLPSIYYKSGAANTAWTKVGSTAGLGGTVTSVGCGTGLTCTPPTPITTAGVIDVTLTPTNCAAGTAETTTAANGTSTCSTFVNASAVGGGLVLVGSTLGMLTTCGATQVLAWNGAAWACSTPTTGTITGATVGGGLVTTGTTLGMLTSCGATQVLAWNGAAWACSTPTTGTVTSVACGVGLSCAPSPVVGAGTLTLNITPTSCAAGSAETATASDGTSTCTAFVPAASVSGTTNTVAKFTSSTAVGNSAVTDDGSVWALNTNKVTITEASGNTLIAGTVGVTGVTTTTGGLTSTAAVTSVGNFLGSVIYPAGITGTVNDWAPTGLSTARTIMEAITGVTVLTGLTGGASGRRVDICNTGAFTMTFQNDNAGSTAANRFFLPSAADWVLGSSGQSCATFVYDSTATRWRMVSKTGTSYPALSVVGNATVGGTLGVTGVTTTTGGLVDPGALTLSGSISPAALSGTNNNYAPAGFATAAVIRQDVSAAATITGLAGGVDGMIVTFINISNSDPKTLGFANESGSSTAANRFTLPDATTWVVGSESGAATFRYDGTTSRWTLMQTINRALVANSINIAAGTTLNGFFVDNATTSPTALSGSTNNYAPANFSTTFAIRQDVSSAATLTGLTAGVDGRMIILTNITTTAANTLTLTNEDGSSTAANRFTLPNAVSWSIPAGGSLILRYDGTSARWRPAGGDNLTPTFSGLTNAGMLVNSAEISPTALAGGTTNDYAPTGFATTYAIRQDVSAASTVSGLAGGATGRMVTIHNIATITADTLTLTNEAGGSTAANRFTLENGASYLIPPGASVTLRYDGTSSRWRTIDSANRNVNANTASIGSTINVTGVSTLRANVIAGTTGTNSHIIEAHQTAPVLTSCGTSPSVVTGNDFAGTFTEGSIATGCVLTFNATFTTAPTCTVIDEGGIVLSYVLSATTITITNVGAASSTNIDYICVGH